MSAFAPVDLSRTFLFEERPFHHFSGVISTGVRMLTSQPLAQQVMLGAMAMLGGAGLGALGAVAWSSSIDGGSVRGVISRLQFWTLLLGWAMYALSATPVYDRYVLAWTMLLPIVWKMELPRLGLIVQILWLSGIAAWLIARWLM